MKLKKLGAFAATGAMALALALTGCGSSTPPLVLMPVPAALTTLRSRRSTAPRSTRSSRTVR